MSIKIIGFKIEGARKIKAMEMEVAESGLIQFAGLNKQGKSTVLDSLQYLFCGAEVWNQGMIQDGAKRMKVEATIKGDGTTWKITRTGTAKYQGLRIKNLNTGAKIDRPPQAFLDELVNQLTWNPFPFKNKTATEKARFIMTLFNIDFTEENKKLSELRQERLIYGQAARSYGDIPGQLEVKPVDLAAMIAEKKIIDDHNQKLKDKYQDDREAKLKEVTEFNRLQQGFANDLIMKDKQIETADKRITTIDRDLALLLKDREYEVGSLEILYAEKDMAPKPMDRQLIETCLREVETPQYKSSGEIDAKISSAKKHDENYREYIRVENRRNSQAEEQVKYDATTEKISVIENDKRNKLLAVKVPVDGLVLTEDGVTYKDRSPENWSSSEEMTIAARLCEGKAPRLAAVFLDSGANYDKNTLAVLKAWAKDKNIQCFITIIRNEIPEDCEPGVFYIENGAIVDFSEREGE